MSTISLGGPTARLEVDPLGGRIHAPVFNGPGERRASPLLAAPPWIDDATLPGHLRRLGGSFVCLPFGGAAAAAAGSAWPSAAHASDLQPMHGPAANEHWSVAQLGPSAVELTLSYPPDDDLAGLRQLISVDRAGILTQVEVTARRTCRKPMAFHPIVALPREMGALDICASAVRIRSHPARGVDDLLEPDREFSDLDHAPGRDGPVDLSSLPLSRPGEAIVQLIAVEGPVRVRNSSQGWTLTIDWDRSHLPDCVLWLSDNSISEAPWRRQFRGLGVEPGCVAFDLPCAVSRLPNPLGGPDRTSLTFEAGQPFQTWCRLSVAWAKSKRSEM